MVSFFRSPSILLFAVLLAVAHIVVGLPDHFILTRVSSLAFARLDPIVNPGAVSGHVHNIMGGSCFSQDLSTPEQIKACDCSSVIINADKSNYWAPALYFQYENGTFGQILNGNRIYYFTKGADVKPFPPGLRMITGLAMSRNASNPRSLGVKLSCDHGLQTQYLPNSTTHPHGCKAIQMGIFFPSCGLASGDLDSDDHFSHMAWPQAHPGGGAEPFDDPNNVYCPDSHPIKYPTIFMEATYYLTGEQKWHGSNPLILSTGDQSGLAYHADFHNGWDQQVLSETLAQCGDGKGVGDQLHRCPPLAKSMNETATWYCRYQNKIPNEDVGFYRPLEKLPGCNLVWPTDGSSEKPACEETQAPELLYPNAMFTNLQFRERVPMLFTRSNNLSDPYEMDKFIPGIGYTGASSIKSWGTFASNAHSLKVSTAAEIEKASSEIKDDDVVSNSTTLGNATTTASSSSSSSSSIARSTNTSVTGSVSGAGSQFSQTNSIGVGTTAWAAETAYTLIVSGTSTRSEAASTSTAKSKTVCKRKRGLAKRSDGRKPADEVRARHLARRKRKGVHVHV